MPACPLCHACIVTDKLQQIFLWIAESIASEHAMRAEWGVPGELMVLPEGRVPYLFRAQELVRRRWIEPFSNEPDAQRKLK